MKLVVLLVSMLALNACTFLRGKQFNSQWSVLEKADGASCAPWPQQEQDLAVNELMLMRGKQKGILATGLKRDGSPNYYYAPWQDEIEFDAKQLLPLKLGRNSVLLGGGSLSGKPVVDVVYNTADKNGGVTASLEVRQVKDNLVRFKGPLLADSVVSGEVVLAADAQWWLLFKKDDSDFGLARLAFAKEKGTLKVISGLAFKDRPVILPVAGGKGDVLVVSKEGDDEKPFKIRRIGGDEAQASNPVSLDIAVANGVESWVGVHYGSGYNLAIVDGDSLIGQAELKVSAFDWVEDSASVKWTKAVALKDVHVSDPVFLASGKGLQVLTLNWVDDESTIARYIVAGGTVGNPVYSGIFPKGSRIVDSFAGDDASETFVIMRHKDDTSWKFQLCRL